MRRSGISLPRTRVTAPELLYGQGVRTPLDKGTPLQKIRSWESLSREIGYYTSCQASEAHVRRRERRRRRRVWVCLRRDAERIPILHHAMPCRAAPVRASPCQTVPDRARPCQTVPCLGCLASPHVVRLRDGVVPVRAALARVGRTRSHRVSECTEITCPVVADGSARGVHQASALSTAGITASTITQQRNVIPRGLGFPKLLSGASRQKPAAASRPFCQSGQKYYTPEISKVKIHWKMPLQVHWTIPVRIHWTSDNPFEHTNDK